MSRSCLRQPLLSAGGAAAGGWGARDGGQLSLLVVVEGSAQLRPVSILRISKLILVDSNFPGNYLWAWEFHPLGSISCLSQTL